MPDGAAQSLATSRKEVIGLVCVEYARPKPNSCDVESMNLLFYDGVIHGVEAHIRERRVARLAPRLPVVVIAGDPAQRAADVVAVDNYSGATVLVEHLVVEHGRRRLFYVDGPATAPDAKMRRLAMQEVIDTHPPADLVGSYTGRFSVRSGEDAGQWLPAGHRGAAAGRAGPPGLPAAASARPRRFTAAQAGEGESPASVRYG